MNPRPSIRPMFLSLVAILACAAVTPPPLRAEEPATPPAPDAPDAAVAERFLEAIDKLRQDPAAMKAALEALEARIREAEGQAAPTDAEKAADEASAKSAEVAARVEELAKQVEAARAELAELEKRKGELGAAAEADRAARAPARDRLSIYRLSRDLLASLIAGPEATTAAAADAAASDAAPAAVETAAVPAAPDAPPAVEVANAPAAPAPPAAPAAPAPADPAAKFFLEKVEPILAANCYSCHGSAKQKGELRLDSREAMLKGGAGGPSLKPGDPDGSLLIEAILYETDLMMPPDGKMEQADIDAIVEWVKNGAVWPDAAPAPAAPAPAPAEAAKPAEPAPAPVAQAQPPPPAEAPVAPPAAPAPPRAPIQFVAASDEAVQFNRDIRPILSNTCYTCHGPDSATRKAGLRLDVEAEAFKALASGRHALVAGDVSNSEAYRRLIDEDPAERMPPASFDKQLTPEQIEKIGRWIAQGAKWEAHWSFLPPKRPEPPAIPPIAAATEPRPAGESGAAEPESRPVAPLARNPIDHFVLARLASEGLAPEPEADRATLARRVTLDLTGLPPTPAEVDSFLSDDSPDAYEKLVDRLLATTRHAEHQARHWLDAARFADTNGYHIDNERQMYRWRDWVIDAYERNMPFDQFTIEQLAGDLLPDATLEQKIASGFNRNHMINFEGGAIPDEYRTNYVLDRVNTTSTVWLGLTMACAQCHDHKYDPISMKDFYGMFSIFNNIPEEGLDGQQGNSVPKIKAPYPGQEAQLAALRETATKVRAAMDAPDPRLDAGQLEWELVAGRQAAERWKIVDAKDADIVSKGGATLTKQSDASILAGGENPAREVYEVSQDVSFGPITAVRLEIFRHLTLPNQSVGRAANGNFVLNEVEIEVASATDPAMVSKGRFIEAKADYSQKDFDIKASIDGKAETGWAVDGKAEERRATFILESPVGFEKGGRLTIRLRQDGSHDNHAIGRFRLSVSTDPSLAISKFQPWHVSGPYQAKDGDEAYATAFEPETLLKAGEAGASGIDLEALYPDGRRKWLVAPNYADGKRVELQGENVATYLHRTFESPGERDLTFSFGSNDGLKVWVNGEVVLDRDVKRGLKNDEDTAVVRARKGRNEILMKVVNHGLQYAFFFRKADEAIGDMPPELEKALATPADKRDDKARTLLRDHYRRSNSFEWGLAEARHKATEAEIAALEAAIPTTMVMQTMEKPRDTFMLLRGAYDSPGEKVEPHLPAALPPLPEGSRPDRLGLAKWLVDPSHPLVARVTVNRLWAQFFGTGLVKSVEDFGSQGELPVNQELLDWLATEFVESGWDVRHMLRLMTTSAAYRRGSKARPETLERDPENRLVARGPRFRLDAEAIRDSALAVSGLLVEREGGPSVKPYQPPGIWEEVAYGSGFTAQTYQQDKGEALYRRSMYTFWKRQAPPPLMTTLDAPLREVCVVRRPRTNTPLQALALMNEPIFVEASRAMAARVMKEGGVEAADRVTFAFRLATGRAPDEREKKTLLELFEAQLAEYRADAEAAGKLLSVGESPRDETLDASELAAWTTVSSVILNLDETVTKG